jgi:hypothetical protein
VCATGLRKAWNGGNLPKVRGSGPSLPESRSATAVEGAASAGARRAARRADLDSREAQATCPCSGGPIGTGWCGCDNGARISMPAKGKQRGRLKAPNPALC